VGPFYKRKNDQGFSFVLVVMKLFLRSVLNLIVGLDGLVSILLLVLMLWKLRMWDGFYPWTVLKSDAEHVVVT
jgi:hypothetical protein